ncbi:MAG: single-stranded-DNA-specific exonuclease RecJ [Anaerolineales bacterium]|nr:single-stranded-DNA-specific exonuclease RecJ [Anaerolineales bacterium]
MTRPAQRWDVKPPIPSDVRAALGAYPDVVAQLLYNRGLATAEAAERYFSGQLSHPGDPAQLLNLPLAVDRLHHALRSGERLAVYGDYDADGVTATALLVQVLSAMGGAVQAYFPLRDEEGYGLNIEALRKLRSDGVNVVVSVDCGVRSLAEAAEARRLGLDLIITDHHEPGAELPDALAVIDPKQPGETYPKEDLAGVGLAYKLAQGLIRGWPTRPLAASDVLDLVALGTVADLAPLTGENRALVRQGLAGLNRGKRLGLRALGELARLRPGQIDAAAIGYSLGPRLNAAGRLENARAAYDLLSTASPEAARDLAGKLESQNRDRQDLTRTTQARARDLALAAPGDGLLLFAADPDFKSGVVGLAAARLTEEFYRPAVVATRGPDETRASCRSIPEFHITAALDQVAELLIRHGGHAAAAGFTTRTSDAGEVEARLKAIASDTLAGQDLRPTQRIDVDNVPLADLTPALADALRQFEPCGHGNPTPVLASRGVQVVQSHTVGADGKHARLVLTDGRLTFDAIAFGQAEGLSRLGRLGRYADLAYQLEWNEFRGEKRLQLNVRSFQPSP